MELVTFICIVLLRSVLPINDVFSVSVIPIAVIISDSSINVSTYINEKYENSSNRPRVRWHAIGR